MFKKITTRNLIEIEEEKALLFYLIFVLAALFAD